MRVGPIKSTSRRFNMSSFNKAKPVGRLEQEIEEEETSIVHDTSFQGRLCIAV